MTARSAAFVMNAMRSAAFVTNAVNARTVNPVAGVSTATMTKTSPMKTVHANAMTNAMMRTN